MIPLRSIFAAMAVVLLTLVAVSVFDIFLAVFNRRFYSTAAFIVLFGVGGVFAAVFAYMEGIKRAKEKNETARWSLILTLICLGALFFFLLSRLEGGEYGPAFKAFGLMTALTSFIFLKGKPDF